MASFLILALHGMGLGYMKDCLFPITSAHPITAKELYCGSHWLRSYIWGHRGGRPFLPWHPSCGTPFPHPRWEYPLLWHTSRNPSICCCVNSPGVLRKWGSVGSAIYIIQCSLLAFLIIISMFFSWWFNIVSFYGFIIDHPESHSITLTARW